MFQTGLCGLKAVAATPKAMYEPENFELLPALASESTYEPQDLEAVAVAPDVVYAPEATPPAPTATYVPEGIKEFPAPKNLFLFGKWT